MSLKRLEFKPESIESLKSRYLQAIDELVDVESVSLGLRVDPGTNRRHVFDLEEGIRFIISREDQGQDGVFLHLSASAKYDEGECVHTKFESFSNFMRLCEEKFKEISGDSRSLEKFGITTEGIIHWFIKEPKYKELNFPDIEIKRG